DHAAVIIDVSVGRDRALLEGMADGALALLRPLFGAGRLLSGNGRPIAERMPGRLHDLLDLFPAAGARLLLLAVLRAGRRNDDLPCAEIMPERRSGDGREHLLCRLVRKVLAALRTRPIFDGTRLGARRRDRIVMGEDVLIL